eukprot:c10037_g2_i2 orf=1-843(-)
MGGEPKFGTQSCPIELETEEEEEVEEIWALGHKKKRALLKTSPLEKPSSAVKQYSKDITMMDSSSLPLSTSLELVPYKNRMPVQEPTSVQEPMPAQEPTTSITSANPKVTAPLSPSIEDLSNPTIAESGSHSAGEPSNPGLAEGLSALNPATHGCASPGESRVFKRIIKGHTSSAGQKTELEREMELFEAAEREEEARLLTSLRHNQSGEGSPSQESPNWMESIQADWKRGPGDTLAGQPRAKRGRKAGTNYQAPRKEEDVCFACFDGGQLILCDKRSCPK